MNFAAHQSVWELHSVWPSLVQVRGPSAKFNGLLEERTRAEHPLAAVQMGGQARSKVTVFFRTSLVKCGLPGTTAIFSRVVPLKPSLSRKGTRRRKSFRILP